MIDRELVRQYLRYDPDTGIWTWIARSGHRCVVGGRADGLKIVNGGKARYRNIGLMGKNYLAHRLAVFYMTGQWPDGVVDHRDHDGENNKWANIRCCTQGQNCANQKLGKHNTSGWKGVFWSRKQKKWCAQVKFKKSTHLGYFNCPAAAHFAYLVAAEKRWGEFHCAG